MKKIEEVSVLTMLGGNDILTVELVHNFHKLSDIEEEKIASSFEAYGSER